VRLHLAVLLALGCAWGLTMPLMRIAVSTSHGPLGIVFWQQLLTLTVCLGLLAALRLPWGLTRDRLGLFAVVAVFGTLLPGWIAFRTAAELPAGIRAILIAIVPMFTLPIALALGTERPDLRRTLGVLAGGLAVLLLLAPGALPAARAGMVVLALGGPLAYAIEANWIAARGAEGLHPFQILAGASVLGALVSGPLALLTGETASLAPPWGPPELAILASGVLNAFAYAGYVWLIAAAGAVFASQIAYLVTAAGMGWSMLLLGERYAPGIWLAAALMLGGIALVRPRGDSAKDP
jgi:drug/metabolite transporter (DMT)-like permease